MVVLDSRLYGYLKRKLYDTCSVFEDVLHVINANTILQRSGDGANLFIHVLHLSPSLLKRVVVGSSRKDGW